MCSGFSFRPTDKLTALTATRILFFFSSLFLHFFSLKKKIRERASAASVAVSAL